MNTNLFIHQVNGYFEPSLSTMLQTQLIPQYSCFIRKVFSDMYFFNQGVRGDFKSMYVFHRKENLLLRWKILENLGGLTAMLDVLLIVFEFLFGFKLIIHIYNPLTQEFLILPPKFQNYLDTWKNSTKSFEVLHILSSCDQPGGFHPVLPEDLSDLEFFGMGRFHEVLNWSSQNQKLYQGHPIDWDELRLVKPHSLPIPLIKPSVGLGAKPEDYNFTALDQNSIWKNFDVLQAEVRKAAIF